MRILIERYIEEVVKGRHYKGYIKIGENRFDCEMEFAIPIDSWPEERAGWPQDDNEWRKLFGFVLRKDGAEIELSNPEYFFFHEQLVFFAQDFYENREHWGCNVKHMAVDAILNCFPVKMPSSSATSSSMCVSHFVNVGARLADALRAPKFGCQLN